MIIKDIDHRLEATRTKLLPAVELHQREKKKRAKRKEGKKGRE